MSEAHGVICPAAAAPCPSCPSSSDWSNAGGSGFVPICSWNGRYVREKKWRQDRWASAAAGLPECGSCEDEGDCQHSPVWDRHIPDVWDGEMTVACLCCCICPGLAGAGWHVSPNDESVRQAARRGVLGLCYSPTKGTALVLVLKWPKGVEIQPGEASPIPGGVNHHLAEPRGKLEHGRISVILWDNAGYGHLHSSTLPWKERHLYLSCLPSKQSLTVLRHAAS